MEVLVPYAATACAAKSRSSEPELLQRDRERALWTAQVVARCLEVNCLPGIPLLGVLHDAAGKINRALEGV